MPIEPKKLSDLPYNTLTVYFMPLLFDGENVDFEGSEFRLVTDQSFFDSGYLKQDLTINEVLSQLYLIMELNNFFTNQYLIHSGLADIYLAQDLYVVYKLNTFRLNLPSYVLTDLQNVLHLRTSALSRAAKKKIQHFWHGLKHQDVLFKVTDEMFPTNYVKQRLSRKLDIGMEILNQMTDITEAIKWETDCLQAVLQQLGIDKVKNGV